MDRFIGMAVFAKVVESASFAAAASHFGMSPGMVSKHVQALEERLGVRLLNRTTRRVGATEVGQDYYERSRRILAELEEAEVAAGDLQTNVNEAANAGRGFPCRGQYCKAAERAADDPERHSEAAAFG